MKDIYLAYGCVMYGSDVKLSADVFVASSVAEAIGLFTEGLRKDYAGKPGLSIHVYAKPVRDRIEAANQLIGTQSNATSCLPHADSRTL